MDFVNYFWRDDVFQWPNSLLMCPIGHDHSMSRFMDFVNNFWRPLLYFMDQVVYFRHDGFFVHYILRLFILSSLDAILWFHLWSFKISLPRVYGQFLAWHVFGWFNKILIFSMGCDVTSCTYILRSPTSYSMDFIEYFWHDDLFWSAWKFRRLSVGLTCHDNTLLYRPIWRTTVRLFL